MKFSEMSTEELIEYTKSPDSNGRLSICLEQFVSKQLPYDLAVETLFPFLSNTNMCVAEGAFLGLEKCGYYDTHSTNELKIVNPHLYSLLGIDEDR